MVWVAGQKLGNNRYTIESQIGAGGLGITYLARSKNSDRVVIKTLKDDLLNNPTLAAYRSKYLRDFWDEAGRLGMCRHRHIVEMGNAFYEGQLPCLVMEYVEGEDLGQRVQRLGILSEAEALGYIGEIGDALTEVHRKNLLHRDIKPGNIMIRALTGEAVLIDFGIAREFDPNLTQQHTQAFTNGFSPIEQYDTRERRGKFSDVYSLAATLYYLLTAQLPIPATSRAAGIELIPPKDHNSNISDTVNRAILVGMEFEGQNRPQSVEEWLVLLDSATALTELEETIEIQINPPPNPVPPPRNPLPSPPIQLISAQGVDYRNLQDLLADRKWQEADQETWKVMLQAAGREKEGFIRVKDINLFASEDLCTIDGLWVHYSDGQFGFSVQKQIYESLGGTRKYNKKIWQNFCDRVGWYVDERWLCYKELIFAIDNTYPGHLPNFGLTDVFNLDLLKVYDESDLSDFKSISTKVWGNVSSMIGVLLKLLDLSLIPFLMYLGLWALAVLLVLIIVFFNPLDILNDMSVSNTLSNLEKSDDIATFLKTQISAVFLLLIYLSIERHINNVCQMILCQRFSVILSRADLRGVVPNPSTPKIPLISAAGIDYQRLQALLAVGSWQLAHEEMEKKMLKVATRKRSGWLRREDIEKFPYEDLHTIDQLWVHYSNGKFGFSVQKRIYQSLGGTRQYNKNICEDFCNRVGWLVNKKWVEKSKLNFTINAPLGHLPQPSLQKEIDTDSILGSLVLYLLSILGLFIGARFFHLPDWVSKWFGGSWLIVGLGFSFYKPLSFGLFWFLLMIFLIGTGLSDGLGFPIWVQKFSVYAWLLGNFALISWHLYDTIQLRQRQKQGQSVSILLSRQSL